MDLIMWYDAFKYIFCMIIGYYICLGIHYSKANLIYAFLVLMALFYIDTLQNREVERIEKKEGEPIGVPRRE